MSLEYTKSCDAFEEASQRINNKQLQEKVSAWLGNIWPQGFEVVDSPVAVFAPYIAKGSNLELDFLKLARANGFTTAVATYLDTMYVSNNPGVVDCYRPPFQFAKGQCSRNWVVATEERTGRVGEAQTVYGNLTIVDYWNAVRQVTLEQNDLPTDDLVVDFSDWYCLQANRFGYEGGARKSPYYYMALMGLYASGRAVLFDTPATNFASDVMLPAANAASDFIGVQPLITVELTPEKRDWTDLSFLGPDQAAKFQQTGTLTGCKL